MKISNVDSIADLIDRLIIELIKMSTFERKKHEERSKQNPDSTLIANYDAGSRAANEIRSALKNKINATLEDAINNGKYNVLKEVRVF